VHKKHFVPLILRGTPTFDKIAFLKDCHEAAPDLMALFRALVTSGHEGQKGETSWEDKVVDATLSISTLYRHAHPYKQRDSNLQSPEPWACVSVLAAAD
jgi:hypothetical protein